jgi:pyridoxine 5-phosphate synthase
MVHLSVNVDHFASLRQARRAEEPEPVLAALLAELAGAAGITAHLRGDRRHINERDLRLLREVVRTKLTLEMAATPEMTSIAESVKPDTVCLVPERPEEVTTTGGLDAAAQRRLIGPVIKRLAAAGIRPCVFIDPLPAQIETCRALGAVQIELHTGIYAKAAPGKARNKALADVAVAAAKAARLGLVVTAGHDLDYRNVGPIAALPDMTELSIGFSIVARAAIVGITQAVSEMVSLLK